MNLEADDDRIGRNALDERRIERNWIGRSSAASLYLQHNIESVGKIMPTGTASYFEERAEEELELAQRATHPKAVKAHYDLAGYYLDRVHGTPEDEMQQSVSKALG